MDPIASRLVHLYIHLDFLSAIKLHKRMLKFRAGSAQHLYIFIISNIISKTIVRVWGRFGRRVQNIQPVDDEQVR